MQALAARDQLGTTEDQVEGVGVLRPLGIGMGVEWGLAHGIARDNEEIAAEFLLCPFAQPAFVLRRQVGFASYIYTVALEDQLLCVGEVDMRYLRWDDRHLRTQHGQLVSIAIGKRSQYTGDNIAQEGHDRKVVLNEAEFDIQANILVDVASGVSRIGAEDRADLEDTLEDTDHNLLVELRALCQVCRSPKVVEFEDVGAALGSRGDNLWRLYLGEATSGKRGAEALHRACCQAQDGTPCQVAMIDRRVVKQRADICADLALVQ